MTAAPKPHRVRSHLIAGAARMARRVDGHRALAPVPRAVFGLGGQVLAARARDESAAGLRAPHPVARMLLEQSARTYGPFSEMSLDAARTAFKQMTDFLPSERFADPVPFTLTAGGHKVRIRVYGRGRADLPVVFYFHGGAFVLGDLDSADPECGFIASTSAAAVVSVGYPLAPERQFPVPVEASIDVVRQVAFAPERFGVVCADEMVLAGESAGANIALNCALALRDDPLATPVGLALVYPMVDLRLTNPSVEEFGEQYLFTRADLERFVDRYLATPNDVRDPLASPVLAEDLTGLPRTIVISAAFDPLIDEAEHLGRRLADAGVDVRHITYERLIHGFLQWRGILPERLDALDRIVGLTRRTPGAALRERQGVENSTTDRASRHDGGDTDVSAGGARSGGRAGKPR